MKFYISDTHFGHANIIEYCKRPFTGTLEMEYALIQAWNRKVAVNDEVWFLGDFTFHKERDKGHVLDIFNQLNGSKHMVIGNHDPQWVRDMFLSVHDIKEVRDTYHIHDKDVEMRIVLCHYPMLSWNRDTWGALHFYGHVHNNPGFSHPNPKAYNLCVEMNDYEPQTLEEIMARNNAPSVRNESNLA
jgi:calcineurin-like phosphoesterase family protein